VLGVWGKKKANEPSRSSEHSSRRRCSCDCLRFYPPLGVCQNQNPTNISSIYSQQQRIAGNLQTGGGQVKARQINGDWGVVDFVETPEGAGCGIIKPHTLFAKSSIHTAPANSLTSLLFSRHPIIPMKRIAADIVQLWADYEAGVTAAIAGAPPGGLADLSALLPARRVMVMSNGQPLGMLDRQHVQELTDDLRKVRGTLASRSFCHFHPTPFRFAQEGSYGVTMMPPYNTSYLMGVWGKKKANEPAPR
jgi:hypothetical protein